VLAEEAGSLFVAGQTERAIAVADRALAVAAELGLPPSPRALGFRGGARSETDPGGIADLRDALALADEQGLGREGAVIRHNLANQTAAIEGPTVALSGWEESIEFSRRRGIHEFETSGSVGAVEALTALGRWDEMLDRVASVRALAEAAGDVPSQLTLGYCTVFVATARGDTGELTPSISWMVPASREIGAAPFVWTLFPPAAWATLELGGPAGRQAAIDLLAEMDEVGVARVDPNYAIMHSTAVRTAVAAGDIALAEKLRAGFEPVLPLYDHMLVTSGAIIAEAKGALDAAATGYADAAARWEAFDTPWERAQAHLGLGRCLIALGRADEAGSPLGVAREVFVRLRARPSIAEVDGLIDGELAESG
jgi:hypothetical protein